MCFCFFAGIGGFVDRYCELRQPLDKSNATCWLNSSHISLNCKISSPIPRLACMSVATAHTSFWRTRSGMRAFAHRSAPRVRELRQRRFASEKILDASRAPHEMHAIAVDDDLAGARPRVVVGAHRHSRMRRRRASRGGRPQRARGRGRAPGNRRSRRPGPTMLPATRRAVARTHRIDADAMRRRAPGASDRSSPHRRSRNCAPRPA